MENKFPTQEMEPGKEKPVSAPKRLFWHIVVVMFLSAFAVGAALYYFYRAKAAAEPALGLADDGVSASVAAKYIDVPGEVRGVYVTAAMAGERQKFADLLTLGKARGMNALVVDLKNSSGTLAFYPKEALLAAEADAKFLPLGKLDEFAAKIHKDGFYLIGRMPVFEDDHYARAHPELALKRASGALWSDNNGLAWLDPAAEKVWKYNAAIAAEGYAAGFDEIQFDYVRFATDGATAQIIFPIYDAKKETYRQTIGRFFSYLKDELGGKSIPISVDLFGFTTWHQTDLGIGQWYDDAIRDFDHVSPMVYPSHYPSGVLKFNNPAEHPYEIVLDSLNKGKSVIEAAKAGAPESKIADQRPWLQAFNLGAKYTPQMVMDQVRAARETGASGFLFWNARNDYSSLPDLTK